MKLKRGKKGKMVKNKTSKQKNINAA